MKYPPSEVEITIISQISNANPAFVRGLVKIAGWLRKQEGVIKPPSTPELVNGVRDVLNLDDPHTRATVLVSWLCAYEEDKEILFKKYPLSWWEGMLKDKEVR